LLEHEMRHNFSRIVSTISSRLGLSCLSLAEDAAQDALLQAARTWPHHGVPDNTSGWLYRVAYNRTLDRLRSAAVSKQSSQSSEDIIARMRDDHNAHEAAFEREIRDDVLLLIFSMCSPLFSLRAQVCLTLRYACGFSAEEIAALLFVKKTAVQQQIVRAKRMIQEREQELQQPTPDEFTERLDSVLMTLYLQFTAGYSAPISEGLIQLDACREALRLTHLLLGHRELASPQVHAIAALFSAQLSRFEARIGADGLPIPLDQQDRSQWQRPLIAAALQHLQQAGRGDHLSRYHLEAAIAVEHAIAPDLESTNWALVLEYYTMLEARYGAGVVTINRLVALSYAKSVEAAIEELNSIEASLGLENDYRLPALKADLLRRSGDQAAAAAQYMIASSLCKKPQIWQWLNQRRLNLSD